MKTRAAVLDEDSIEFEIRTLDVDEPKYGEVHVRFVAAGLCHSDLHSVDRILLPRRPIVMGHEGSGIVEKVGPGVTKVEPGDHIVCSFVPNCGRCRRCRTARTTSRSTSRARTRPPTGTSSTTCRGSTRC